MENELSKEEQSKDRYFSQIAKLAEEMTDEHGKDFATGAFVLAARWIAAVSYTHLTLPTN